MDRLTSLGARGYITKPFLPEELREVLERTLASSTRRAQEQGQASNQPRCSLEPHGHLRA